MVDLNTTFIYALIDPRNNRVRYVGKSNSPRSRLLSHINSSKKKNTHKANWIRSLLSEGRRPLMEILEEVPKVSWKIREKYWINFYKPNGYLTNTCGGGEGSEFGNATSFKRDDANRPIVAVNVHTKEVVHYKSGLSASKELGKKYSYALHFDRIKKTKGHIVFYLDDFKNTPWEEVERRISLALISNLKANSGSFKAGLSAWNAGKHYSNGTAKAVVQLTVDNEFVAEFYSCREAGKSVGSDPGAIRNICKGINHTCKGYKWKFAEDYYEEVVTLPENVKPMPMSAVQDICLRSEDWEKAVIQL